MRTFAQKPKATQQTTFSKSAKPSRPFFGQSLEVNSLLHLQRTIGNQAVQRFLRCNVEERNAVLSGTNSAHFGHDFSRIPVKSSTVGAIQTKLAINKPGDEYEQEADRVARQVMCMPDPQLKNTYTHDEGSEGNKTQNDITQLSGTGESSKGKGLRNMPVKQPEVLSRQIVNNPIRVMPELNHSQNSNKVPAIVGKSLHSIGTPLETGTRKFMESRFGHDFSAVKVHTDALANTATTSINARAFTSGHHIAFGHGEYAPHTNSGRHLLSHELTHVIQQSGNYTSPGVLQRQIATGGAGGISKEWLDQIARVLYQAMKGPGTDEEAIYSAFSGRTQEQVNAIAQVYKENYGSDLIADIKDELSESEMEHLSIFSPTAAPGVPGSPQNSQALADMVASQLNKAMDRVGTDEESIYSALTGRTQAEIDGIKAAYKRLTKRELADDIRDEMSGDELKRALFLLNQNVVSTANNARLHLFTDIDVKYLGIGDVFKGDVGHTWISLEYKDTSKVPATVHSAHKPLLSSGGKYSDPMGFWPAINENIYYSANPFASWVKGWMRHPDRAHEGSEKAAETWDLDDNAVEKVIKYAESRRSAKYSVFFYNCTTFAKEAVEVTGNKAPSMTQWGFAMPNAVYDGIKERQKKGVGRTWVKDFDTGKEQMGIGPDEQNKKH